MNVANSITLFTAFDSSNHDRQPILSIGYARTKDHDEYNLGGKRFKHRVE